MIRKHPIDGAVLRQSVVYSLKVSEALANSVDVDQIVHQWLTSHPEGSTVTPAEGRAWAELNIRPKDQDLEKVLLEIYGIGAQLGTDAAKYDIARAMVNKADSPNVWLNIDWNNWKPGNHPAQALVRAKGGLKKLLDRTGTTIKDMGNVTVQRIGTYLANGLKSGISQTDLAKQLQAGVRSLAKDPVRALTIAHTEMNRVLNAQKVDSFRDQGIEQNEWMVTDPCDTCAENDGEVRNLGDEFPSGDDQPPVHPNCNCTLLPVIPYGQDFVPEDDEATASEEAQQEASNIFQTASLAEPAVTEAFTGLVSDYNKANNADVKMVGLQYRLKTEESLARKLDSRAAAYGGNMTKAVDSISDSLRYTMMAEPRYYSEMVNKTLDDLRAGGYQMNVKNYWKAGSDYKGINVAMISPTGQKVELQFHTPKSLLVKEHANHYLYEQQRVLDPNSKEYADLQARMVSNSNYIRHPKGAGDIGKMGDADIRKALRWA